MQRITLLLCVISLLCVGCGSQYQEKENVQSTPKGTTGDLPSSMSASGVAYMYTFADGSTVVTLNLNVLDAPKGQAYVGWLAKREGDRRTDWIKMNELYAPFSDARHGMKYEANDNLLDYDYLAISQESDTHATAPTKIVADGTLKIPSQPPKQVTDTSHGKQTGFAYGALSGVRL